MVTLYKVPSFDSVDDFLQKVAMARGKFKKGGVVDIDVTARIVLHDWNEGKSPLNLKFDLKTCISMAAYSEKDVEAKQREGRVI